ncbi:hypothetical protein F7734_06835 [Scytonema sp. UIC 10036]|uniref:hypothetical protein n=1 Tax=Scytonema sp. UIC 10036 TaxID=2304196 RepID=UPI0012DAB2C1|nr:hypothetical protein [Scytonema sp. UIC 10036]MUG92188.1 hypothetical protein [Scytonema sp. UIC 10036]
MTRAMSFVIGQVSSVIGQVSSVIGQVSSVICQVSFVRWLARLNLKKITLEGTLFYLCCL